MLSKCANPGCPATFHYLHQGKLFRMDTSIEDPTGNPTIQTAKPARRVEFFWLCSECATEMTLSYDQELGLSIVSRPKALEQAQIA